MNCIVTGASGALGSVITSDLREAGHAVWGLGSPRSRPDQANDPFPLLAVDLGNADALREVVEEILAAADIQVWVNVAGGFRMGPLVEDTPGEDWQAMWTMNFLTALNGSQIILPHFRKAGFGRLIQIGALAAISGMPNAGAYIVSKAALHALTQVISHELSGNITCNAILPGIIDTPANRAAMPAADRAGWTSPHRIAKRILDLLDSNENGHLIRISHA